MGSLTRLPPSAAPHRRGLGRSPRTSSHTAHIRWCSTVASPATAAATTAEGVDSRACVATSGPGRLERGVNHRAEEEDDKVEHPEKDLGNDR
eukprot:CAMPEP_0206325450 /NCGR_PEP_ID=MMETSP0106_2-20121207/21083_1 /ASSEMBLY_ACC=CAM_ASM_000206 /TAXON_ID=81532 /ORGANISM="Acanthoeca-like sp., Strain 10tr" /LENGTH=91 /DNA_ID=CAMNT_0053757925 /DNA_START=289 /DNA_END=561 /DNA_ORIENTATION=+